MSFPRYPEYKDSGVEWLGEIPAHWGVCPLKRQFEIVGGSTPKSEVARFWDGDIPWATPADLSGVQQRIATTLRSISQEGHESCGTVLVPRGSVILSTRAPIGSLAIADIEMTTNQGCKSLVPKSGVLSEYYAHVLSVSSTELNARGKGTTFLELSGDSLGAFTVPVPLLKEQKVITAFLDAETAKIDALVTEQERLIELLKEKRQALVSHAVTRGLNPGAPMKDSGIAWLGEIPAHWEVFKMKWVAEMDSGHTPDRTIPEYWDGDVPWVSLNDTAYLKDHDYISNTARMVSALGLANSSAHILPSRTVVFSRDATIGRCAITTRPMAVSQHFIAWICNEMMVPEFLLLRLRSMSQELDRLTTGATVKTIGMPEVRTLVTPVPPVEEQHSIIAVVRERVQHIDALTTEAQRAIELLQERRSALISAAVTGKIDVR